MLYLGKEKELKIVWQKKETAWKDKNCGDLRPCAKVLGLYFGRVWIWGFSKH